MVIKNYYKSKIIKILFAFFFTILSSFIIAGQIPDQKKQNAEPCKSEIEFDNVLSNLFPKYFLGSGNAHTMILSYDMSYDPEIQINILFSNAGKSRVYLYKATDKSIRQQFYEILEKNCNATYSEIIKQIKFKVLNIELTENEILQIRNGFSEAVEKSIIFENRKFKTANPNLVNVTLHSPYYIANYSGSGGIRLSGEGNLVSSKPHKDEPPFIEWMRKVYRLVESKTGNN